MQERTLKLIWDKRKGQSNLAERIRIKNDKLDKRQFGEKY